MSETINLNNVTGFRISDLIGGLSPKKSQDAKETTSKDDKKRYEKKPRRTRNAAKQDVFIETSSFKMSNRLAVHGNKPKKQRTQNQQNTTDVLWMHNEKLRYFRELQEVV